MLVTFEQPPVRLPNGEDGFDAVFVTASGEQRRVPWRTLPRVVDEIGGPVRLLRSFRGQSYPGWYWSATLGRRIGFGSWVARDHLVALDFDPEVVDIVSQPFRLVWCDEQGKQWRHAPDFLVRLTGGRTLVLDSRARGLIGQRDRAACAAMSQASGMVGWEHAVWDRLDPVTAANHRWLGGYRHPRCFDEALAGALLAVFAQPQPLMDGAETVGDPLGTLPVLYHLMWRHWLVADLSVVLSHRTVVRMSPEVGWRKAPADGTCSAAPSSMLPRRASHEHHHHGAARRRRSLDAWAAVTARPGNRRRGAGHRPRSTLGPHRSHQSTADRRSRRPCPLHAGLPPQSRRIPHRETFDAWAPNASSIPPPTQQALQTLEWVSRGENLVVCGPAGTGKTFFLEALGQKIIEAGMPVAWFTLEGIDPVNADVGQASTQGRRPSPGRGGSPIPAAVDRESRQRW